VATGRSGLALIGMGVAVVGYALAYSGVSNLDPCITPWGVPVSTMVALVPGAQPSEKPDTGTGLQ